MNGGGTERSDSDCRGCDAFDVPAVLAGLDQDDRAARREAIATVREAVDRDPATCTPTIPKLRTLLERPDGGVDPNVAYVFAAVAEACPTDVAPSIDAIVSALGSSEGSARTDALRCLAYVAESCPESVVDHVEEIASALEGEPEEWGLYALSVLSAHDPRSVRPAESILLEALETDPVDDPTTAHACTTLGRLVRADPEAPLAFVDRVIELARRPDASTVRADAVGCLADVAHHHPAAVEGAVPTVADALEASDPDARANAAIAISRIAAGAPGAVERAEGRLLERLDDENAAVRRNATIALARGEVAAARDRFESLARADDDPAVRECASWALGELPEASTTE